MTRSSVGLRRGAWSQLLALLLVCSIVRPAPAHAVDRVAGLDPKKAGIRVAALPDVGMKAGMLVTEDGQELWERAGDERRSMASLTKLMTAAVALEHSDPDDIVVIPARALTVGESTSYLVPGQRMRLSELLEALLVKSGNDAAMAIAVHVAGDEPAFARLMNKKAAELGMLDTRFANSHGLDQQGHYSTARDLSVLARYAMSKPLIERIVARKKATIKHAKGSIEIETTNVLLHTYDGADGVKTGFTSDAGYCLAASATREGTRLYAIVLGTPSDAMRVSQARTLLDWGWAHYRPQQLVSAGTVLGQATVGDYLDVTVPGAVARDVEVHVLGLLGRVDRTVTMSEVRAPVAKGDRVGVATFRQQGMIIATVPLLATEDVKRPGLFERGWIGLVRAWRRYTGPSPVSGATAAPGLT